MVIRLRHQRFCKMGGRGVFGAFASSMVMLSLLLVWTLPVVHAQRQQRQRRQRQRRQRQAYSFQAIGPDLERPSSSINKKMKKDPHPSVLDLTRQTTTRRERQHLHDLIRTKLGDVIDVQVVVADRMVGVRDDKHDILMTPQDLAVTLINKWQLGSGNSSSNSTGSNKYNNKYNNNKKDKTDGQQHDLLGGVLILAIMDDRKIVIEFTDSLNPILNEAWATELLYTKVTPSFRNRQYATGIEQIILAVDEKIDAHLKHKGVVRKRYKKKNDSFFRRKVLPALGGATLGLLLNRDSEEFRKWWWQRWKQWRHDRLNKKNDDVTNIDDDDDNDHDDGDDDDSNYPNNSKKNHPKTRRKKKGKKKSTKKTKKARDKKKMKSQQRWWQRLLSNLLGAVSLKNDANDRHDHYSTNNFSYDDDSSDDDLFDDFDWYLWRNLHYHRYSHHRYSPWDTTWPSSSTSSGPTIVNLVVPQDTPAAGTNERTKPLVDESSDQTFWQAEPKRAQSKSTSRTKSQSNWKSTSSSSGKGGGASWGSSSGSGSGGSPTSFSSGNGGDATW